MIIDEDEYLIHYGIIRRSGRYPWGSGGHGEQNHTSFLGLVESLKSQGFSDAQLASYLGITQKEYRDLRSIAINEQKAANIAFAQRLRDKGWSHKAIAERMGLAGESSVRSLLAPGAQARSDKLLMTANMLKDQIADGGYLDVGVGTELYAGVSRTQLDTALTMLRNEGYEVVKIQVDQVGGTNKTTLKVLVPEGSTARDVYLNMEDLKSIAVSYDSDAGEFVSATQPISLDSKRVQVTYAEDGGADADGVLYIRPGVDDLDLGGTQYAQVRVAVDDSHYLKGMAIYKTDMPDGVDVIFNTNKSNTGNDYDAMKKMNYLPELDANGVAVRNTDGSISYTDQVDWENPFGATIKAGGQRGVLNVVNEEGDWKDWSKNLASQMLSKQKPTLAKEQLDKTYSRKRADLDEILELTNPAVKRRLLESYSDDVDSAAVHLQAAAMPRQATKVILPVNSLRDTEIYAPTFKNGERVALVRYPHGGTFEIPELIVNNRQREAKGLLGNAVDAVGINSRVAERLSGADFDGDTVLVIPNNAGKINSKPPLEGLKNFDPKVSYPAYEGMPPMSSKTKQIEMGNVSNLITDMTIRGANDNEIAAAVRHSMVVIDAEKHNLNYKQSHRDNGIANLKEKYQGGARKGASTLISQTTSEIRVPATRGNYQVDRETGEKIYTPTGEGYTKRRTNKRTGEVTESWEPRTKKSTKGAETRDAHTLSSGTPVEKVYADHSNRLKALGNEARKAAVTTKNTPYSSSARKIYEKEVKTLGAKLNVALKNAPRERQAQVIANATLKQRRDANPDMDSDDVKKASARALATARARTGARKQLVTITDGEWEAIQAGAVTNNQLRDILNNTDLDTVKQRAMPRQNPVMTNQKQQRARSLLASGRTPSEVAEILGVALSTLTSSMS